MIAMSRTCRVRRSVTAVVVVFLSSWFTSAPAQQSLEPRAPAPKLPLQQLQRIPASNQVVVKFREGTGIRFTGSEFRSPTANPSPFVTALGEFGIPIRATRRMHTLPEAELDAARAEGQARSGRELADLNLYYVIDLPPGTSPAVVANRLNALDIVEFAEPAPLPSRPPTDIPPTTPDFTANQGYKNDPPQGIGVGQVAVATGNNGANVSFVDVEYSWQLDHEDLELPNTRVVVSPGCTPSDPFNDTNHGTAVLGQIVGRANAYGVTGIAPGSFARVAPANCTIGYFPAAAITASSGVLQAGDVIIIEQQTGVCGGVCGDDQVGCGPLEGLQSVFDAVSTATANGRVVVAAAGNGNVNLDAAACGTTFDRTVRDSRAIIVGAGSSTNRSRLSFSSFGSRVDVQGWGNNVMTTGYGDTFDPPDILQRYTSSFGGTSSATPIVAGAVLAIQGIRKACLLQVASPTGIRTALTSTGTPQATPATSNIGPLPRIREALIATGAGSCLPSVLQVSPATQIAASGPPGGPFTPSSFQYQLSAASGTLTYSISGVPNWLTPSSTSGTLTTTATTVTFTVNSNANALPVGTHGPTTITFSNTTNSQGNQTRTATLSVGQPNYTIAISASPPTRGSVTGGGVATGGTSRTVTATPFSGNNFVNWTESGVQVSTSAAYTFTVTGNRTLVANFAAIPVNFTIAVDASPTNGGSVAGGGTFQSGTSRTVTATPNSGFSFVNWTENGAQVSTSTSYTFTLTGNRTLVANFSQQTFTITVSASPSAGGTVSGGGTFASGTSRTVTATPNSGYSFVNWTENGNQVSTSASYTFAITGSRTLVANFRNLRAACGGSASQVGDFNGDLRCDLVLRHTNGTLAMYLWDRFRLLDAQAVGQLGPEWQLAGISDFNGDGKSDMLFRRADGTLALYLWDGFRLLAAQAIGQIGPEWTLAGVGDFNGDGKADTIFRHRNGAIAIYLWNGFNLLAAQQVGQIGTEWELVAVGDFNGDGRADTLFRKSDGTLALYLWNGFNLVAAQIIGQIGPEWRQLAVGDFNGDGKSDILFRRNDGALAFYLWDGFNLIAAQVVGQIGPEWARLSVGDFNGDSKSDTLLRRTDGALAIYLWDGFRLTEAQVIGQIGPEWN